MLQVGAIGCGEIAQMMHIPYYEALPEAEVTAIADPASNRRTGVGDRYDIPHRFESGGALLDALDAELDAVLVLTPAEHHADLAIRALNEGIYTFVEKPIAISFAEAQEMVAAAEESTAVGMVGYMKRYDPTYRRYRQAVAELDQIDLVTAYSVDPDHGVINEEVYDIVGGGVPADVERQSRDSQLNAAQRILDTDDDELAADYLFHLKHACHDVNALRGLFGPVMSIEHAQLYADGRYLTAQLRYADQVHCTLHSGRSDRKWFEETIRVDHPTGMITLDFDNPYLQNAPTELHRKNGKTELTSSTEIPSYEESFKIEAKRFINAIKTGETPRTTFSEASADVRLIADLVRRGAGKEPIQS